jgi:predicted ribosome quality control (RQC) complex YloA/Tae2 family protein
MKVVYENDIKYIIGENAKDNWNLLDMSDESDYFFHLSSFPSCYVIMESQEEPTKNMLEYGAFLCKNSGKYKSVGNLKIDYCKCSNLKKGDKVGEVIYIRPRQVNRIKN